MFVAAAPAAADWTGRGEAGIALATGNTKSQTANVRVAVRQKLETWEYTGSFQGLYVRNEGETTARRWEFGSEGRYTFTGRKTFVFGGGRYEQDRFSGFDHQGVINMGVGHRFHDGQATQLSAQVGVGYKFWETLRPASEIILEETSHVAGVAGVDFKHQITETTSVFDRLGVEITSDNNFLQNEVGIAVKISNRVALALAYAVRHNTSPPRGFKRTDTLTTANLVYEVK